MSSFPALPPKAKNGTPRFSGLAIYFWAMPRKRYALQILSLNEYPVAGPAVVLSKKLVHTVAIVSIADSRRKQFWVRFWSSMHGIIASRHRLFFSVCLFRASIWLGLSFTCPQCCTTQIMYRQSNPDICYSRMPAASRWDMDRSCDGGWLAAAVFVMQSPQNAMILIAAFVGS